MFDPTAQIEDDLLGRMMKKIFDKNLTAGQLDKDVWQSTTDEYWKALQEGYGKLPKFFDKAQIGLLEMRRNVNTFAAFKNHTNVIELTRALTGEDGQPLSFSAFKKVALGINEKYNVNWLQAEYNYATRAASAAAQWQDFERRGGKLQYFTIGDGRVRDEHKLLNGTILPVTDNFWNNYYPPNGWNCRCYVRWRPDDTSEVKPLALPDVKEMFRNNVGKTSQVFDKSHPFIREAGDEQAQRIRSIADRETMRFERGFIRKAVQETMIGKKVVMESSNFKGTIGFTGAGVKEAVNQPHSDLIEKNRALLSIEERMKSAEYIGSSINDGKDRNVKQFHYFMTSIADNPSYIVVKEMMSGEYVFYSIVDAMK